jgi:hypothetical protein
MPQKFKFRGNDHIGAADAESDHGFLDECFINTGEIELLLDCDDHRRIVLGRTGAGKTALLSQLPQHSAHVINIQPESLALAYISNSTILQFVDSLGVNLDTFFKLLWRHVFTVEVIKAHFSLDNNTAKETIFDWIKNQLSEKRRQHEKALAYLERWGSTFWEQTDYRIEELTTKLENSLKASIGADISVAKFGASVSNTMTQEEKGKIVERAKHVVNQVQIQELSYVLELLDNILEDPQNRYYLVIDRLDENWVEDRLRYMLIRALVETVRDFRRVRHAKIIVALRYDLLDRVLRVARGSGFQEEKYESLDSRIAKLVRQSYTSKSVTHEDILPASVSRVPVMDYILSRTFMRPRDVIIFFNLCIAKARENPQITPQMLKEAEGEYSRKRLGSLADEWAADYPYLTKLFDVLKGQPSQLSLSDISQESMVTLAISLLDAKDQDDNLASALAEIEKDPSHTDSLRRWLAAVLYRTGAIGLKLESYETMAWSISGQRSVSISEIQPSVKIAIHPCFWRSLGINPEASTTA